MSFSIQIEPDIEKSDTHREKSDLLAFEYDVRFDNFKKFNLIIIVNENKFCYYPQNIMDLYIDIIGEINSLTGGCSHEVCIGGYPLLYFDLIADNIKIYDAQNSLESRAGPVIAELSRIDIEDVYWNIAQNVYEEIDRIKKSN